MATNKPISGTFTSLYIGSAAASGSPMSQVFQQGTGGYVVVYNQPRTRWVRATGHYEPTELSTIEATLAFLSDEPTATKLAMGNLPTTANEDDVSSGALLSVLFYDAINPNSSIFIPVCQAEVKYSINRNKDKATQVGCVLKYSGYTATNLFWKRPFSALKTIMGSQSPSGL